METMEEHTPETASPPSGRAAPVRAMRTEPAVRHRASPWLIAALVAMTATTIALGAWIALPRLRPPTAERVAGEAVAAWDSGISSAFAGLYARDAVLVRADGTKVFGLAPILAEVRSFGRDFAMSRTGSVSVSGDGAYAAAVYRYTGGGKGTGLMVVRIEDGKIVRQWMYQLP